MNITRNGIIDGSKTNYQLLLDGVSVGRIKVRRTADPCIAARRTYLKTWEAKRSGSVQSTGFDSQVAAEAFLLNS